MSSLHESSRDTARVAQDREQPAGSVARSSYSSHFHLNYVTTLHGMQSFAGDTMVHRIRYSCRPATGTSNSVAQVHMSIIRNIELKDKSEMLDLHFDTNASESGPAPGTHRPPKEPDEANDALQRIREKRTEVLNEMFGIWKDRADIPDGLQFQKAMRDEWR